MDNILIAVGGVFVASMGKMLGGGHDVSEFEFQFHCYVHFRTNALTITLIPPSKG